MTSIRDYKNRVKRSGSLEQSTIQHSRHSLSTFFKHSPSYEEVRINDSAPLPAQIVSNGKDSFIKTLIMYPGLTVNAGDVVYRIGEETWLSMDVHPNPIYTRSIIRRCNQMLRWIDDEGELHALPAIFSTMTGTGIDEDSMLSLPAGKRKVITRKNEQTVRFHRDLRFLFGSEAFKITDVDTISVNGLVQLSLESDQINVAEDNLELGIANYRNRIAQINIEILNGVSLSIGLNQKAQLNIRAKRNDLDIQAPLLFTSSNESIVTVSSTGLLTPHTEGQSVITVIGPHQAQATVTVQVSPLVHSNYTADVSGPDSISFGRTALYQVHFQSNGNTAIDESQFILSDQNGNPTTLATLVSQDPIGNTCMLKARSKVGTVILHVQNLNGLSKESKSIRIKSLL